MYEVSKRKPFLECHLFCILYACFWCDFESVGRLISSGIRVKAYFTPVSISTLAWCRWRQRVTPQTTFFEVISFWNHNIGRTPLKKIEGFCYPLNSKRRFNLRLSLNVWRKMKFDWNVLWTPRMWCWYPIRNSTWWQIFNRHSTTWFLAVAYVSRSGKTMNHIRCLLFLKLTPKHKISVSLQTQMRHVFIFQRKRQTEIFCFKNKALYFSNSMHAWLDVFF